MRDHRSPIYSSMIVTGELNEHLVQVQEEAQSMLQLLIDEMLKKNPAPDKATHQMEWVEHMNSLKAFAEEVILQKFILC